MTRMAGSTYDLNKLGSILFKDRDTTDPWINHLDESYNTKPRFQKPDNVIKIDGSDIHLPQDTAPTEWFGPNVGPTELPLMKDRYLRQPTVLAQGLPEMIRKIPGLGLALKTIEDFSKVTKQIPAWTKEYERQDEYLNPHKYQ